MNNNYYREQRCNAVTQFTVTFKVVPNLILHLNYVITISFPKDESLVFYQTGYQAFRS